MKKCQQTTSANQKEMGFTALKHIMFRALVLMSHTHTQRRMSVKSFPQTDLKKIYKHCEKLQNLLAGCPQVTIGKATVHPDYSHSLATVTSCHQ